MTTTGTLPPAGSALGERAPADTRRRASSLHPQPCVRNCFNCHRCYSATFTSFVFGGGAPYSPVRPLMKMELGVRVELTKEQLALLLTRQVQSTGLCEPSKNGTRGEPNRPWAIRVNPQNQNFKFCTYTSSVTSVKWWVRRGTISRRSPYEEGALPVELQTRVGGSGWSRTSGVAPL